jgi:hypothetical protein
MPIGRYKVAILADSATVKLLSALILAAILCDSAAAVPLPLRDGSGCRQGSRGLIGTGEPAPPSACRLRLTAELAAAPSLPALAGPGECGMDDVVRLEAVLLPDKTRVAVTPPAILRCTFAEAIVHWVREDVAPSLRSLGAPLRSIDNYAAYDCRGRNRVIGAKLSEHGKGNALDMRSFARQRHRAGTDRPAGVQGASPELAQDYLRALRTVLGPGSDGYHENHVHVDRREARRRPPHVLHGSARSRGGSRGCNAVPLPLPRMPASAGPCDGVDNAANGEA